MAIVLRPYEDGDCEQAAALNNQLFPDHRVTPQEWRRLDQRFDPGHSGRYARRRFVAVDKASNQLAGYGVVSHLPVLYHPQWFWCHVMVDPEWQRRGIGALLIERLLRSVRDLDVRGLWTEVREDRAGALRFAQRHGFAEARRTWELRLDVAAGPAPAASSPPGVTITTLAAARERDPACAARLYSLLGAVGADVPAPFSAWPLPFADFARWLDYPDTLRDGLFIACASGEYVGLSITRRTEGEPGTLYVDLTGVRRDWRRRGVALALKQHTIEYARHHGLTTIAVRNDSANAGMIALNLKLGFRYHAGWVTLVAGGRR